MAAPGVPVSLLSRVLRPWWRLTRGLTLGAQGVVLDAEARVLLVRHGYRPGWFFPGGGVERHETVAQALAREVLEESGVELTGDPQLHGLFANIKRFPGDHIAVYVIREWRQPRVPRPNAEIVEQGFFPADSLPKNVDPGTRRRMDEILHGAPHAKNW
ncbi:MAG: NUDIX domain-containing protein [Hyphomicrobiales bacterium]|nr:NUDIX domain-containing protein [Hyphomicrobiales bacterium]